MATSGEWIYQESYRSNCRKDLLRKYYRNIVDEGSEISLEEDTSDAPQLVKRERLNRMHANSVVGTYYYMAPEVLQGDKYNATADWYRHLRESDLGGRLASFYTSVFTGIRRSGLRQDKEHRNSFFNGKLRWKCQPGGILQLHPED